MISINIHLLVSFMVMLFLFVFSPNDLFFWFNGADYNSGVNLSFAEAAMPVQYPSMNPNTNYLNTILKKRKQQQQQHIVQSNNGNNNINQLNKDKEEKVNNPATLFSNRRSMLSRTRGNSNGNNQDVIDDDNHQLMQNLSENKTCTVSSARKSDARSGEGCSIVLRSSSASSHKHTSTQKSKPSSPTSSQEQQGDKDYVLSAYELNPYLVIDLKAVNYIDSIHIHRASMTEMDFSILTTNISSRAFARNETEAMVSSTYNTHVKFDSQDIVLSVHAPARYVRVQALARCSLELSHIQVSGLPPGEEWPYTHQSKESPASNALSPIDGSSSSSSKGVAGGMFMSGDEDDDGNGFSENEDNIWLGNSINHKGCIVKGDVPLLCSNRGTCVNGRCHCDWLYTGSHCQSKNLKSWVVFRFSGLVTTLTLGYLLISYLQNRLNVQGVLSHIMSFPPLFTNTGDPSEHRGADGEFSSHSQKYSSNKSASVDGMMDDEEEALGQSVGDSFMANPARGQDRLSQSRSPRSIGKKISGSSASSSSKRRYSYDDDDLPYRMKEEIRPLYKSSGRNNYDNGNNITNNSNKGNEDDEDYDVFDNDKVGVELIGCNNGHSYIRSVNEDINGDILNLDSNGDSNDNNIENDSEAKESSPSISPATASTASTNSSSGSSGKNHYRTTLPNTGSMFSISNLMYKSSSSTTSTALSRQTSNGQLRQQSSNGSMRGPCEASDSDDDEINLDEFLGLHFLFASPLVIPYGNSLHPTYHRVEHPNNLVPLDGLGIVEECELLQQSLKLAAEKPLARYIPFSVSCGTASSLSSMLTLNNTKVLHISAHSHPEFIAFEDDAGGAHIIKTSDLGSILKVSIGDSKVQLVVINSCHSYNIAKEFCSVGIPHVIALLPNRRVRDSNATIFTRSFYLALACGRTVAQSFEIAKVSVRTAPNDDPTASLEADYFVLLPENGDHSIVIWPPYASREIAKKSKQIIKKKPQVGIPQILSRSNIPSLSEVFLGRRLQVYEILRYLQVEKRRILLIVGDSGIGKSEVAISVGHHLSTRGNQVFWIQASSSKVLNSDELVFDLIDQYHTLIESTSDDGAFVSNSVGESTFNGRATKKYLIIDGCDRDVMKSNAFFAWCSQLMLTTKLQIVITTRTTIDGSALPRGHVTYYLHSLYDEDAALLLCKLVHRPILVHREYSNTITNPSSAPSIPIDGDMSDDESIAFASSGNFDLSDSIRDIMKSPYMKGLQGHPAKIKAAASKINSIRCISLNEPYILPRFHPLITDINTDSDFFFLSSNN